MSGKTSRRGASITLKVDLILLAVLSIGVGAALAAFAAALVSSLDGLTGRNLEQQGRLLHAAVESFMLPGDAPIAVGFFGQVAQTSPESRIVLFRRDGKKAFSDNETIDRVNSNLKRIRFQRREGPSAAAETWSPVTAGPRFEEAAGMPPRDVSLREEDGSILAGGRSYFRAYRPLLNLPKCVICHGSDHTVRGVIDIRSDVTHVVRSQVLAVVLAGALFVLLVGALALVLGAFLRRTVLDPVRAIGRLCSQVTEGRFEGRVEARGGDEIAELGRTVNGMVVGLRERHELTKYVSEGTIGAIAKGQEPHRLLRTLLFTDIRGFTSYTERFPAEHVVSVLNAILEAESEAIHSAHGDIDKFVGDEVVAVFSGEDAPIRACACALAIMRIFSVRAGDFDSLAAGAGIATGQVVQGMIGSARRADYTVIGDSVNVASRLCALAKGRQVLVCEVTRKVASADFEFAGPYEAALKGKSEAQRVWALKRPLNRAREAGASWRPA
jgi:adenylate cyclase